MTHETLGSPRFFSSRLLASFAFESDASSARIDNAVDYILSQAVGHIMSQIMLVGHFGELFEEAGPY